MEERGDKTFEGDKGGERDDMTIGEKCECGEGDKIEIIVSDIEEKKSVENFGVERGKGEGDKGEGDETFNWGEEFEMDFVGDMMERSLNNLTLNEGTKGEKGNKTKPSHYLRTQS